MDEIEAALKVVAGHPQRGLSSGGATDTSIDEAADELGVRFPPSFRRFLATLGAGTFSSEVFAGLTTDGSGDDVRRLTRFEREAGGIGENVLIVGVDGTGGSYGLECLADGGEVLR